MNAKVLLFLPAVAVAFVLVAGSLAGCWSARAEEDVVAVDTSGLKSLGKEWVTENPYNGNKRAIEIGSDGYNQNCARCHGLDVKSGGLVPDLRYLPTGKEGDHIFYMRMLSGAQKDGRILMPKFDGILPQELLWAIRTFVESKHLDN